MSGIPRCQHCNDVIGVYEPMVVVHNGAPRETSRAAEQDDGGLDGELFHAACYEQAHDRTLKL
jgi:hypothetical protein